MMKQFYLILLALIFIPLAAIGQEFKLSTEDNPILFSSDLRDAKYNMRSPLMTNDCSGATLVCGSGQLAFNPTGPGANDCAGGVCGCLAANEHQSVWYYVEIDPSSPPGAIFGFIIVPNAGSGQDYDFAVWGPNKCCGSLGSPLRCSFASGGCTYCPLTGVSDIHNSVDVSEGAGGDGFVKSIITQPGQGYYILIDNFSNNSSGFTLNFEGNAILSCAANPACCIPITPPTPITKCQGAAPFGITVVVGGAGATTYSWAGADATQTSYLSNPNIQNPNVTIPPGFVGVLTYTVSVTRAGCTKTATLTITVTAGPTITLTTGGPYCPNTGTFPQTATPTGGTWSGTGISAGGVFNTATAAVGNNVVTYSVTTGGCTVTSTATIVVNPLPIVTVTNLGPFCKNITTPQVIVGNPAGGTWGGVVNSAGEFTPSNYPVGNNAGTYTYTDPVTSCTKIQNFNIVVAAAPIVNIVNPGPLCDNVAAVTLNGTPAGGTWSGDVNSSQFNPMTLGAGSYTVTYTFTNAQGCTDMKTIVIVVKASTPSAIDPAGPFCTNAGSQQLVGSPTGGTFSGSNVTASGVFNPNAAPGNYTITYNYTNSDNCVTSATTVISIQQANPPTISAAGPFCVSAPPQQLTANPSGGIWGGSADANGVIDPSALGVGAHSVTYSYTNSFGCQANTSRVIIVTPQPTVTINPAGPYCDNVAGNQQLSATPGGGVWGGTANANGQVNPSALGPGTYTVTYSFSQNGCTVTQMRDFVVNSAPLVDITPAGPFCKNLGIQQLAAAPLGGVWSGAAVNAQGQVNTTTLNAGTYTITYKFTDANGCMDSKNIQVIINPLPVVSISTNGPFCVLSNPVNLIANPSGGVWGGAADPSGVFDPTALGIGTFSVTYTVTDVNGCVNTATKSFVVSAPQNFTLNPQGPFCSGLGNRQIIASPTGGTWGGVANASGIINTNTLGVGIYTVTYTFPANNICSTTKSIDIEILPLPDVELVQEPTRCKNEASFQLMGTPIGGTWSGSLGVNSSGFFNPNNAPVGNNTVRYTATDLNGCKNTATMIIELLGVPTASIVGNPKICAGSNNNAALTINTTGSYPLTLTYSINGVNQAPIIINGNPFTLSTNIAGTYKIVDVLSGNGCQNIGTGTGTVTVVNPPKANNIQVSCTPTQTSYIVTFQITGGNPATYSVTGGAGTVTGSTFTSTPIPSGTPYSFTLTDANGCTPEVISGTKTCGCLTTVGTMDLTTIEKCGSSCITALYDRSTQVSIVNDTLEFILHTGSSASLGTIIKRNATPTFCFTAPAMSYETTYYISAVVGKDSAGQVMLSSPCTDVAQGSPIIFHKIPTANIAGDTSICLGKNATLPISLTGNAPYDIAILVNGQADTLKGISVTDYEYSVSPTSKTTYQLVTLKDAFCDNTATGQAIVTINNKPTVSDILENCNVTNTGYIVAFTINGGNPASYKVTGGAGTISGNSFTSALIPSGTNYQFLVDDGNACGPTVVTGVKNCLCSTTAGVMDITPISVCGANCASAVYDSTNQVKDGDDVVEYILHTGSSNNLGTILATSKTAQFCFAPPLAYGATYYISAVVGSDSAGFVKLSDPCLKVAKGTPVIFNPIPTASIGGNLKTCLGNSTAIPIALTGTPPWKVVYQINNNPNDTIFSIFSSPFNFNVNPSVTTAYTLVKVIDVNCENNSTGTVTVAVNKKPTISNIVETCNNTGTGYTVTFDLNGGDPTSYSVTGNSGTITGNTFKSDQIPSLACYVFRLDDANQCGPDTISNCFDCSCLTRVGTMSTQPLEACKTVCLNPIYNPIGQFLDANDTLNFILHDGGTSFVGNILKIQDSPKVCFDSTTMQIGVPYFVTAVAASKDSLTGLINLSDACRRYSNGTKVTFQNPPTAIFANNATICLGDSASLNINLTGKSPWSVYFQENGVNDSIVGALLTPVTLNVSPNANATFIISNVKDNLCGNTAPSQSTVKVNTSPTISSPTVLCDGTGLKYSVSFNISGGDPTSYSVAGSAGILTGNIFKSDFIVSGGCYSFVAKDANGCKLDSTANCFSCQCLSAVGSMSSTSIEKCGKSCATALYNPTGQNFDADDILRFYLHTSATDSLVGILASDSVPTFCFDSTKMSLNTVYYISAVVGSNDGTGQVNLNDICKKVSVGTPIVFRNISTAKIGISPDSICKGDNVYLQFTFTGDGPFEIKYSDGTQTKTVSNISTTMHTELVNPIVSTKYKLISAKDLSNPNCMNIILDSTKIFVSQPLIAEINPTVTVCTDDLTKSALNFNTLITSGSTAGVWTDLDNSGASGTFPSKNFAGLAPGNYQFKYQLTPALPCAPSTFYAVVTVRECICPSVETSEPAPLCNSNAVLDLNTLKITPSPGVWSIVSSPSGANPATLTGTIFNATNKDAGAYNIEYRLNYAPPGCPFTSKQTVIVEQQVTAGTPSNPIRLCGNTDQSVSLFSLLTGEDGGGKWSDVSAQPSTSFNATNGTFNPKNQTTGIYKFRYIVTATAPCINDTSIVEIEVQNIVSAGIAKAPAAFCTGFNATQKLSELLSNAASGGIWVESSGVPSSGNAFNPVLGTFSTDNQIIGVFNFKYIVNSNSVCPSDEEEITVVILPKPLAYAGKDASLDCIRTSIRLNGSGSSVGSNFEYMWTTDTEGVVILDPTTLQPTITKGGIYTLMVTNKNTGCFQTDQMMVEEKQSRPKAATFTIVPPKCSNTNDGSITLESVLGGTPPYLYAFQSWTYIQSKKFEQLGAGTYKIRVQDANGCDWDTLVTIVAPIQINIRLGNDTTIRLGDTISIPTNINFPAILDTITWTNSNTLTLLNPQNPTAKPVQQTNYKAIIRDINGCTDEDDITIFISKDFPIFIPNIFSPDNDGSNDKFTIYSGPEVAKVSLLRVFDRWGTLQFENKNFQPNNPDDGWDGSFNGKPMNPAVFVYYTEILFKDGHTETFYGDVTLRK